MCVGGWNVDICDHLHMHSMVADGYHPPPLRHRPTTKQQPMDLPRRRRFLRCLRHMGAGGPSEDIRQPRRLPRRQLVLPGRRRGAPGGVAGG